MTIHTVRQGDTVYQIARQYAVLPAAIVRANGLQDADRLVVGQALIVPTPLMSYVVRAGDTLYKIAQRFGLALQSLLGVNLGVNPERLHIGQVIRLPRLSFGNAIVNGYCYPTISDDNLTEALKHLSFVSVFSAHVRADGGLTAMQGDTRVVQRAKAAGVRPHMVIANIGEDGSFSSDIARSVLNNPAYQERLLRQCVVVMREKGYTGLDVDFEYVPADAKEGLNAFLARARSWMHDEGWLLCSAIESKTSDNQPGLLYAGFDFTAQGKYNDYVTLMTYDWGYISGPPGPVAPVNEVRKVLEYAVSRIPRDKILMGVPAYGYDWKIPWQQGTTATVVQSGGAVSIAARNGANIEFDERAQTPFFRYREPGGQRREVWFEDARSLLAKYELVREMGIAGVSYWTVNNPFPQNWTLIDNLWRVRRV